MRVVIALLLLAASACAVRFRPAAAGRPASAEVLAAALLAQRNPAAAVTVADSAAIVAVGALDPSAMATLSSLTKDRIIVATPKLRPECAVGRVPKCDQLIVQRYESRGTKARVTITRNAVHGCGFSEQTIHVVMRRNIPIVERVELIEVGDCG